ncbi:MAG: hypothetical protein Ct9H300mP32_3630 [Verrucomicrobiota bacterium]|nr:MAG: hypothetical protein Ct9H300mP32_3630 [Verrucomicrobiota bacterium]
MEIAYLIDPDEKAVARKMDEVRRKTKGQFNTKGAADIREALADKSVDAISIATPNHWHSLMTIWGAQAGKHVYVEKPMSHDVHEGRVAVEAQRKYGVVIQHGTQQRSSASVAGLHEMINAGKFGKLKISYGYCCKPRGGIGFKSPSARPRTWTGTLWGGPAVIDTYQTTMCITMALVLGKTRERRPEQPRDAQLDVAVWGMDPSLTNPVRRWRSVAVFSGGIRGDAEHHVWYRRVPEWADPVFQRS